MHGWITIKQAQELTGKSDKTIRRWIKCHQEKISHVDKSAEVIRINSDFLIKEYPPIIKTKRIDKDYPNNHNSEKTSQMQIVSYSETIRELSDLLKRRDDEVKKGRLIPIWLTLVFCIMLFFLYIAFLAYKGELLANKLEDNRNISLSYERRLTDKANQIRILENSKVEGFKLRDALIEQQIQMLNEQNKSITQQRQELAQKDLLISQLYNDTKAQNKKLLELTESLKSESIKNEQNENNLPEKETQKQ